LENTEQYYYTKVTTTTEMLLSSVISRVKIDGDSEVSVLSKKSLT